MHATMLAVVSALASLSAVLVNGETIVVKGGRENNLNSISKAILTAPAGSVLQLLAGDYYQTEWLKIDKPLMIQGAGPETRIHVDSMVTPVLLHATAFKPVLTDFVIVDSLPEVPTVCAPDNSVPAGDITIFDPPSTALLDGTLRITGSLGQWANLFEPTDIRVGDCDYQHGDGSQHLSKAFFEIASSTCEYYFGVHVQRQSLEACGIEVIQEGNGTVSTYKTSVQLNATSMVDNFPVKTTHNGQMEVEFSESGDGGSVISEDSHVHAVLSLIELGEVNENTSYIELSLTMPAEFHVPSEATGPVEAALRLDDELSTTAWFPMSDCGPFEGSADENGVEVFCRQIIGFRVTACDVSAHYHIDQLPVECKELADCGANPGYKATLNFAVDATGLCAASDEADVELNLPIESIVKEMRSNDFQHELDTEVGVVMGKTSYWMIELDTGTTGLVIDQAELVAISRNVTNRDCSDFEFYRNVGTIAQRYLPPIGDTKGRLEIELPVDQTLACDDGSEVLADGEVTIQFTYLVSYQDYEGEIEPIVEEPLTEPERRRSARARRESGQLSAEAKTHVRRAAAKQVFAAHRTGPVVAETPVMFEMSSADTVSVVAGMSALLLIAVLSVAGLWYGFKKIADKSKTLKAQKYEVIGEDGRGDENFSSMYEYSNAYTRDANNDDMTEVMPNRPSMFDGGSQYDSHSSKNKGAATSL